jgi:hypothetical protein
MVVICIYSLKYFDEYASEQKYEQYGRPGKSLMTEQVVYSCFRKIDITM